MQILDWLLRRNREDDLQAEIRAHLSMAAADRMDDGSDREAARLAALREFGNVTLTREATRLAWGERLRVDGGDWKTVVGVADDLKYFSLNEQPRPYLYVPFAQMYAPFLVLQVRTTDASPAVLEQIRARVQAMDANLSISEPQMMTRYLRMQSGIYYLVAIVFAIFGTIALLLAALGTYGLISYSARQSAHEIGVRIAIGANRSDVMRRFLGNGLRLGAWGAAAGLVIALGLTRLVANLFYGVSPTDPVAFASALGAVLIIVLGASFIPAWRASRTDPIAALRHR